MELGWRRGANVVLVTFVLTSAFWLVVGFWLFGVRRPDGAATHGDSAPPAFAGKLAIPVAGVSPRQLVDTFTQPREDGRRRHDAIDIAAPEGTPVIAAAPGRVEKLFASHDGGNTVYVRMADGATIHYYAHLRDYAPGLHEGQSVGQAVPLGTVGHSGNADPAVPHLHFQILRTAPDRPWSDPGTPINPYPLLVAGARASAP